MYPRHGTYHARPALDEGRPWPRFPPPLLQACPPTPCSALCALRSSSLRDPQPPFLSPASSMSSQAQAVNLSSNHSKPSPSPPTVSILHAVAVWRLLRFPSSLALLFSLSPGDSGRYLCRLSLSVYATTRLPGTNPVTWYPRPLLLDLFLASSPLRFRLLNLLHTIS